MDLLTFAKTSGSKEKIIRITSSPVSFCFIFIKEYKVSYILRPWSRSIIILTPITRENKSKKINNNCFKSITQLFFLLFVNIGILAQNVISLTKL